MTSLLPHSSTAVPPLRDLDDSAFTTRYGCDRLTAAILVNRFRYVNAHMAAKLHANAFSVVIRDMDDFCTTIQGPPELSWAMPAASLTNPVHWGPVSDAVGIVLEEIGLEQLRPGDVIACNDSYRTGKHLNDMSFIRPLFHDDVLVGAVHVTAHQLELGSRVPGGFDLTSQSLWEDGLVLTPTLLYSEGSPVRSAFSLVAANTRAPEVILSDFEVIRSTLDLGEELLVESMARYGVEAYLGAIRYACDMANEEMTRALAILPDGVYDGEHVVPHGDSEGTRPVIRLRVVKRGDRMEFDFGGTSAQTASSLNCSWLDAKTGVALALTLLFDRRSVPNTGSLRSFDFVLPPGSMLNAYPPAATMTYYALVDAVMRATIDALNPVLGADAIAFDTPFFGGGGHRAWGTTPDGARWEIPTAAGNLPVFPKGATRMGDADGYGLLAWTNMPTISAEVLELVNPLLVLEAEAVPDTSGPGYHRGGPAMAATLQYVYGGTHHHGVADLDRGAAGAHGGGDGRIGWVEVLEPDTAGVASGAGVLGDLATATSRAVPADGLVEAGPGIAFRMVSSGGGGWGDPWEREPERVLGDVRDGYVSIDGAARDYGVVVVGDAARDPHGLAVDEGATQAFRRARRSG